MIRLQRTSAAVLAPLLLVLLPSAAYAQASIAGVVTDASGAVLPGVTVEASSPALIEKVRTVVTDGSGQYRIVDLRPGEYRASYVLSGFRTAVREGIVLEGTMTATVNIAMQVGALEETVTVSGEAPVVDVQGVTQQHVMSKEVLDVIPTGRMQNSVAVLIPGVASSISEVGGSSFGELAPQLTIHGSRTGDARFTVDGLSPASAEGTGQFTAYLPNMSAAQEITIDTSGVSAESSTGGVQLNLVPKQGGNRFSGTFFIAGSSEGMVGDNYSADLEQRGLAAPNTLRFTYDINPGFGGPLLQDRLWFYTAARWAENQSTVAGLFYNLNENNPNVWTYAPDTSRQGENGGYFRSYNARLTWQATPRNKFSVFFDDQDWCTCPNYIPEESPEFGEKEYGFPKNRFATATWTAPVTSRLLLEAGLGYHDEVWQSSPKALYNTALIPVQEQSLGLSYRGGPSEYRSYYVSLWNYRAEMSYVTGSHAAKLGFSNHTADKNDRIEGNDSGLQYRFNNGIPNQISMSSAPYQYENNVKYDIGVFVQDRWTVRRLTLNGGARFDFFSNYAPAQTLGPSQFTPNRNFSFPETEYVTWRDVSPRLGAAYDLFGTGRTAVKAVLNRYVQGASASTSGQNPLLQTSRNVTRTWDDRDVDYVPDCNLLDPNLNGECGRISDLRFGGAIPSSSVDPETTSGWGKRPYNWEFSTSVQHQITPRVAVDVGYFRRWYGNFTVNDNRAVTASDFGTFSVVAPVDPRLPDGGGYTLSGLKNVNPDKFGQVDNLLTFTDNFGTQTERYNGLDVNLRTRFGNGIVLQGGMSTGRTVLDNCEIRDVLPEVESTDPFCHKDRGWLTQVKALGSYMVPRIEVQLAGTFQSYPGPRGAGLAGAVTGLVANVVYPNSAIQPSLGRPLSGANNVTVNVMEPGHYGERVNQLDFRVSKILRFGGTRTLVGVDIFNAFNSNAVLSESSTYAIWRQPQAILVARYFRISAQLDF